MKIIVLAGGLSTERDVSLASAPESVTHYWRKDTMHFFWMYFSALRTHPRIWKTSLHCPDMVWKSQRIFPKQSRILQL